MGDDRALEAMAMVRALELTIQSLTDDLMEARARAEAAEKRCAAFEASVERSALDRTHAENRRLRKAIKAIRALTERIERGEEA